jgi:HPt (histidine-containing phosphotransfer) domain-containing protein
MVQVDDSGMGWIYSSLAGEPDFDEILPFFVDELPGVRSTINQIASRCDFDDLRRESHKLKGSAGGYGFQGLSEIASRLEESCKISPRDEALILRTVDELVDYLDRVRV